MAIAWNSVTHSRWLEKIYIPDINYIFVWWSEHRNCKQNKNKMESQLSADIATSYNIRQLRLIVHSHSKKWGGFISVHQSTMSGISNDTLSIICSLLVYVGQWDHRTHLHTQRLGSPDLMQSQHSLWMLQRALLLKNFCWCYTASDRAHRVKTQAWYCARGVYHYCWF